MKKANSQANSHDPHLTSFFSGVNFRFSATGWVGGGWVWDLHDYAAFV